MYSEMNELFKIMLIQLTRMFFLSKLRIMHFLLFFFFFPPYQQLKRVFKHVLYLAESIIVTFDFEKMNVLIDEPFNLAGECSRKCYNRSV